MDTSIEQIRTDKRKEQLKALGLTIARLREERGLTQADLAMMLGYTNHAHMSRIESGKKPPNMFTLFEIAEILEVRVAELFNDV